VAQHGEQEEEKAGDRLAEEPERPGDDDEGDEDAGLEDDAALPRGPRKSIATTTASTRTGRCREGAASCEP
jgi:hypothetical protein